MKRKEHMIDHPSQLNSLSVMPFMRTTALGRLRLGGNLAEHPGKKLWEARLNRHYYACGCDTGAIGLIVGLVGGGAFSALQYFQQGWRGGSALCTVILITVVLTGLGKLFGLLRARRELLKTVREIQQEWIPIEKPNRDQWSCG